MRKNVIAIKTEALKAEDLNGAYKDIAELLGIETALQIHSRYRGTQMFFPMEFFSREYISERIAAEYDGHNTRELAQKYNYTEKWIRKIIKDHPCLKETK